ncbi:MAG: hypothetical protein QM482_04895 [Sulfurospirillum sp.]
MIGDKFNLEGDIFKTIVDLLNTKNLVLHALKKVDLTLLNTRKKIQIFSGVTEKRYYISIFFIRQKSRFLKKNASEIVQLCRRLEELEKHAYKNKLLVISSPLCSKASSFLKEEGWKIVEVKDDTL